MGANENGRGGRRCESCGAVGVPAGGSLCRPCQIEEDSGPEAKRAYLQGIARKGGMAATRSRQAQTLDPEELGPLEDHQDAARWCRTIATAIASGRVSTSRGQALLAVIKEWRSIQEGSVLPAKMERLKSRVEELEAAGVI